MERWEWLSSASKKYRGNIGESARTLGSRHSAPPGRCPAHVSWPSCLKTPCPGLEQGDTHHHRHPLESIRFQLLSSCLQRFPCRFRHHPTCREDQGDEASIGERPGLDSSPLYLLEVCGLLDDVEREVLGCRFGSLTAKEGVNLDIEVHSPLERPSEPDIVPPPALNECDSCSALRSMVFKVECRIRATESCLATVCLGLARQTSSCPKEFNFEHHGHVVRGDVDRVW